MATMKTLNGYGFNATELNGKTSDSYLQLGDDEAGSTGEAPKINADTLGGVAASNYLQKTDTASDTSKLGGKAPEYYIQPRNLLDNSYWAKPEEIVNQRGFVSGSLLHEWTYFIDRWREYTGNAQSTFTFDTSGSLVNGRVAQKISNNKFFSGKPYTYAVYFMDDTVICASGIVTTGKDGWNAFAVQNEGNIQIVIFSDANDSIGVYFEDTGSKRIKGHALIPGSYTADTLPPYVPKGYAAELAECRRHAKRITGTLAGIAHGYASGKAYATIFTSGPKMRIGPSVDDYSKIQIINGEYYSDSFTSITSISNIVTRCDSITFWIESSEISPGKDYYISCEKGVLFSSDL